MTRLLALLPIVVGLHRVPFIPDSQVQLSWFTSLTATTFKLSGVDPWVPNVCAVTVINAPEICTVAGDWQACSYRESKQCRWTVLPYASGAPGTAQSEIDLECTLAPAGGCPCHYIPSPPTDTCEYP